MVWGLLSRKMFAILQNLLLALYIVNIPLNSKCIQSVLDFLCPLCLRAARDKCLHPGTAMEGKTMAISKESSPQEVTSEEANVIVRACWYKKGVSWGVLQDTAVGSYKTIM